GADPSLASSLATRVGSLFPAPGPIESVRPSTCGCLRWAETAYRAGGTALSPALSGHRQPNLPGDDTQDEVNPPPLPNRSVVRVHFNSEACVIAAAFGLDGGLCFPLHDMLGLVVTAERGQGVSTSLRRCAATTT